MPGITMDSQESKSSTVKVIKRKGGNVMRQSEEHAIRPDDVSEVNSAYNKQGQKEELVVERYKDIKGGFMNPFTAREDQFKLWKEFCEMIGQEKVDGKYQPKAIDLQRLMEIMMQTEFLM